MPDTRNPVDSLTPEEVDAALRAMTPADWARVQKFARILACSVSSWTDEDLISTAYLKLREGERIWRRGVGPVVTLGNVLRSLASNERKKESRGPIDRFASVDVGAGSDDHDPPGVSAVDDRCPSDRANAISQLAEIERLLAGDEDAQMVLMAWADNLRGKEAAEELRFDKKRYDNARKRLERKLETIAKQRKSK